MTKQKAHTYVDTAVYSPNFKMIMRTLIEGCDNFEEELPEPEHSRCACGGEGKAAVLAGGPISWKQFRCQGCGISAVSSESCDDAAESWEFAQGRFRAAQSERLAKAVELLA